MLLDQISYYCSTQAPGTNGPKGHIPPFRKGGIVEARSIFRRGWKAKRHRAKAYMSQGLPEAYGGGATSYFLQGNY